MMPIELDRKQTHCLAHAVYHEARGEPIMGQAAVSNVILNRVKSKRHPDTICDVVYQPWQFTDIKKTKINYTSQAWKNAVEVAAFTQVGYIDDETNGGTMYANLAKCEPNWDFSKLKLVGSLGGHTFYREI